MRPILHSEIVMQYAVVIEESDEGFAVSVPGLPGCHSQGTTEGRSRGQEESNRALVVATGFLP